MCDERSRKLSNKLRKTINNINNRIQVGLNVREIGFLNGVESADSVLPYTANEFPVQSINFKDMIL